MKIKNIYTMLCMFYFYREMLSFHHGHHQDCIHDHLCVYNCLDHNWLYHGYLDKNAYLLLGYDNFCHHLVCYYSLGIRFKWLQIICVQYISVRRIWCCWFVIFNACWWMMTLKKSLDILYDFIYNHVKPEIFIEREIIWIDLHHHDSFIFVLSIKKGNPFNNIRKLSDLNIGWNK